MREIKFRVFANGVMRKDIHAGDCLNSFFSCASMPIVEFTGLKDINGVDIYEGDVMSFDWKYQSGELYANDCKNIVGVVSHCGGRFVVKFFSDAMQFDLHEINQSSFERLWRVEYNSAKDEFFKMDNFKVIGNIYENPELLENKDD